MQEMSTVDGMPPADVDHHSAIIEETYFAKCVSAILLPAS